MRADPVLDRIAQRGLEHEQRFLEELNRDGLRVVEIPRDETLPRAERLMRGREATIAAMREGADVIYQAVLFEGRCLGYADFLRRMEQPSDLGPWRYEVWDTKLARHAKASAVLQLAMYSELLEAVQGQAPAEMHLVLGGVMREKLSFRVADYAAYYRSVARGFEALLDDTGPSPDAGCLWWSQHPRRGYESRRDARQRGLASLRGSAVPAAADGCAGPPAALREASGRSVRLRHQGGSGTRLVRGRHACRRRARRPAGSQPPATSRWSARRKIRCFWRSPVMSSSQRSKPDSRAL